MTIGYGRLSVSFAVSLLIGVMVSKPDCVSVRWEFKSQNVFFYLIFSCLIS